MRLLWRAAAVVIFTSGGLAICPTVAKAQAVQAPGAPTATPPSPDDSDDPDDAAEAANVIACTPVVSVVVSSDSATAGKGPPLAVQPVVQGSVFTKVRLPFSSTGKAPAATVTLSYGAAWAGTPVWVQPLRGGTCAGIDRRGVALTSERGFFLRLDATGSGTVTFQPPHRRGTYKVLTRISNVATSFVFLVHHPKDAGL